MNAITTVGGSSLVPHDMNGAMQMANMMSTGRLVPAHLQKSPGDCLMVIEQAMRWNMSPFAVAQCTSVIQGRMMFEGKLVAAAVQSSGILDGRLNYEFAGEGEKQSITVSGTIKGEAKPREMSVALKDAKTTNQMWTKQPQQQLVYFATRAWARRHTPEVMLGVYSPEEFPAGSFDKPHALDTFRGTTLDADPQLRQVDPNPAANPNLAWNPALPDAPATMTGNAEQPRPKPRQTVAQYLDALGIELANASTAEADEILARSDVQKAQDTLRGDAKDRLQYILDQTIARLAAADEKAETEAGDALFAPGQDDPFRQPVPA